MLHEPYRTSRDSDFVEIRRISGFLLFTFIVLVDSGSIKEYDKIGTGELEKVKPGFRNSGAPARKESVK